VIYVVDDNDRMRRALDTLLSTVGYKTAIFSGPREFLAHFNTDTPGCVVLDNRMPEMSGLELQQQLNRMDVMIPVIFITGHGDVPMRDKRMGSLVVVGDCRVLVDVDTNWVIVVIARDIGTSQKAIGNRWVELQLCVPN